MKIQQKTFLFPLLALGVLSTIYMTTRHLALKNGQLGEDIEHRLFNSLEMDRNLLFILTNLQRRFLDAVSSEDLDLLEETQTLKDAFTAEITKGRKNEHSDWTALLTLEQLFKDYFDLTHANSIRMIQGDNSGTGFQRDLEAMTERYNKLRTYLEGSVDRSRLDILTAFEQTRKNNTQFLNLLLILTVVCVVVLAGLSLALARSITGPIMQVVGALKKYSVGETAVRVPIHSKDEIGALGKAFNELMKLIAQADRENDQRNWLKTSVADLNKLLQGDLSVKELGQKIIVFVADTVDAKVGLFYHRKDQQAVAIAGFCVDLTSGDPPQYMLGTGLVGQAMKDHKSKLVSLEDPGHLKIQSGLVKVTALMVSVEPVLYDKDAIAVIELGLVHELTEIQREFLDQAKNIVGIALNTAESREKVGLLFEEKMQQARKLEEQQAALKEAYGDLEQQTQNLIQSEKMLKIRGSELRETNEELEKRSRDLERQKEGIRLKNLELKQSNKYKSEFLANVSHELRTPLNSIILLSKMISDDKSNNLNAKQIQYAETVYNAGKELLELINETLTLSKAEAGKIILNPVKLKLATIVAYVRKNFEVLCKEKGLNLVLEIEPDVPEQITTDRQRVEQILKNLVANAVKFTREGTITFRIRAQDQGLDSNVPSWIILEVKDTGIGIATENLDRIFDAFHQADGGISRNFGGTGLGLTISRDLAAILGGRIEIQSTLGEGSTFTLVLPLQCPGKDVSSEACLEREAVFRGERNLGDFSEQPAKENIPDDRVQIEVHDDVILIIEDDVRFSKALMGFLRGQGFKCLWTTEGKEGISLTLKHRPVGILLDINLPDMNGWEIFKELRNHPKTAEIPIHIISAFDPPSQIERDSPSFSYTTKPVSKKDLDKIVLLVRRFSSASPGEILIVEDSTILCRSLKKRFSVVGIPVVFSQSGEEARTLLNNNNFCCVILDLGLPDMDGAELLVWMRNTDGLRDLPVVVYTGRDLPLKEKRYLEQIANSVVSKASSKSMERLIEKVREFIKRDLQSDGMKGDFQEELYGDREDKVEKPLSSPGNLKGKVILVVDDDVRNIFAISNVLEDQGMIVHIAVDGAEAVKFLSENPNIDLVLMDIMMPVMNGYEATQKIRSELGLVDLPIIAVSAKALHGDREACLESGADDYLPKPLDPDVLSGKLMQWLAT